MTPRHRTPFPQRARLLRALVALMFAAAPLQAQTFMIDRFEDAPETRWSYLSDQVMGGASEGQAVFATENGARVLRLTGAVSTANNGGFIQARRAVDTPPAPDTAAVELRVRGNGERYFVHLRTTGTRLPWQYYQAGFDTTGAWQTVRLPLSAFAPSGALLRRTPRVGAIRSIAVVAFGRPHRADLSVSAIGFHGPGD